MEEKREKRGHRLTIDNRKKGTVSGVEDVLAFDVNEIRLETELGMLTVRGKELHLSRLSLDQGEVDLEGTVEADVAVIGAGITGDTDPVPGSGCSSSRR